MKWLVKYSSLLALLLFFLSGSAQTPTQTIRGTVTDKHTKMPVPGANVVLLNSDPIVGTVTDLEGRFRLEKVEVGRVGLQFSFMGYNTVTLNNLDLASGKEMVLNITLEEKVITGKEVEIVANKEKDKTINRMATVSARTFSIDEGRRYAGSLNDVARMAQNFAGVQGGNDTRNDIIVRGNSPTGVLYRMEGMDIPNPNHFATSGTTGGPISVINFNVLANSDFMTGAFPAEYGNALAGVFDLKMRNGNNEQHEFTGQLGMNGAEMVAEGPFKKGGRASYMAAYRYSTLDLFKAMGINFGSSSVPDFTDLNFKLHFPSKKGSTSLIGIGGHSYIEALDSNIEDDAQNQPYNFSGNDIRFKSQIGAVGLTHTWLMSPTLYLKATVSTNALVTGIRNDSLSVVDGTPFLDYENNSVEGRQSFSLLLNKKLSSRHFLRAGWYADRLFFNLSDSTYRSNPPRYKVLSDFDGATYLVQPYVQWQFRVTNDVTFNTGSHYQYFALNHSQNLEPRAGLKWRVNPRQAISIGYGLHSQTSPTPVYFEQEELSPGEYAVTNQHIGFTKSHHLVLQYDWSLNEYSRLKTEAYYQYLYQVPVDMSPNSYSMLNQGSNFGIGFPDYMWNKGTGTNYGVELTLERFLHKGLYYLITTSVYESFYEGSDGVERHTAFSGNYTFNALVGKEFALGNTEKGKRHRLTFDLKATWNGGQRYVPIDLDASRLYERAVYKWKEAYEPRYPDYIRPDLRIGYKFNGDKITQEVAVDLQNIIARKNVFSEEYNEDTGEIDRIHQLGFLPIVQYRILF